MERCKSLNVDFMCPHPFDTKLLRNFTQGERAYIERYKRIKALFRVFNNNNLKEQNPPAPRLRVRLRRAGALQCAPEPGAKVRTIWRRSKCFLEAKRKENVSNGCGRSQGISIIEAVIALLIITIMVGVLLTSQGKSLRMGVSTMLEQRIIQALEQRFVEIDKDHLDARKKEIVSQLQPPLPAGSITYTARRPAAESAFHRFENLYIETLTAKWQDRGRETQTQLVRFHTHPEEKQNE
jgi:Tfp pilus assembly protein PilV